MPGGYQPPPAQIHPGPGCTVVHPVDDAGGAGVADGSAPGRGMPGGYQPPPAQIQPGPGFTVVHMFSCCATTLVLAIAQVTSVAPTRIFLNIKSVLLAVLDAMRGKHRATHKAHATDVNC
jgi:hypothetical protein